MRFRIQGKFFDSASREMVVTHSIGFGSPMLILGIIALFVVLKNQNRFG